MFNIDYRFIQCFPTSFQSWHRFKFVKKNVVPTQILLLQAPQITRPGLLHEDEADGSETS